MFRGYAMKSARLFAFSILFAALLPGCVISTGNGSVLDFISVQNGSIAVLARNRPDAIISAAGELSIDGRQVPLAPTQQALARQYYVQAMAICAAGIATGVAGADLAHKAVGNVVSGLAHGQPDAIGPKIDAEAKKVEAQAMKVCTAVADLRTTQNALAASLQAFKPYALILEDRAEDCRAR
jgi:long-subunit acyl-CoA synthetase (AMP-forming)